MSALAMSSLIADSVIDSLAATGYSDKYSGDGLTGVMLAFECAGGTVDATAVIQGSVVESPNEANDDDWFGVESVTLDAAGTTGAWIGDGTSCPFIPRWYRVKLTVVNGTFTLTHRVYEL